MTFELGKKTFDCDAHQTGSAKAGHVTEDVGRVQTLLVNFNAEFFYQRSGNFLQGGFG